MSNWLKKIERIPDEEMKIFVKISEMCVKNLHQCPEVAFYVVNWMLEYIEKNY